MEVTCSDYHCRWCSVSYTIIKSLKNHERNAHPAEKLYCEDGHLYQMMPLEEKKKWFTCNICSIPVLIQYRLLHNSSHNHIQRTIEPSIQKGTPEVDFRRGGSIELAAFDLKRDEAIKLSRCSQKMFQAIILKMACVLKDFRKRHIRL